MKQITAAMAVIRAWGAAYWGGRNASEVARQYRVAAEVLRRDCPLVLADFARFCLAFDTTFDETSAQLSARNQGRREAWLFLKAAFDVGDDDLEAIKLAMEDDNG